MSTQNTGDSVPLSTPKRNNNNNSDSDSDVNNEHLIGNVQRVAIVPPNYEGKPKKGHLIFDASFECGNLGRVDYVNDNEYDLFIRPDTCGPRFRSWFLFTVENVKADQRVIFHIVNFSKAKSLYRDGMTPLVKSTSRKRWQRLPTRNVFYYRCPDHRKNYVMSFTFCFDREDDVYQFAYSFPYTYTKLQNYLDNIEQRQLDYVQRRPLVYSVQKRRLDLLTIANPALLSKGQRKKVVIITARVHPGETPSSYVCQGFIEFLISDNPIAQLLRDNIVFYIVPMLNPDGVFLGNQRCSLLGFDLNRVWNDPSHWAHPEIYGIKTHIMKLNEDADIELDFFIDIHAHSTMMNGFMYGNVYEDANRFEKHNFFPRLLSRNAEDFSINNTAFNRDAMKAGTGRRTLGGCLQESTHCYTLEVSFFSYQTSSNSQSIPYTEDLYQLLGRNLARTFLDYYKSINYISWSPSCSMMPRLKEDRIRSRLSRQSPNISNVNQDEAFLNGETFNLNVGEMLYSETPNDNELE
ncbi:unnamed protein product [Adineta steineri]|uniref:Peptidase M14 domain-containing protein n=1 Tax=Adineta steineri TaxID=433720 RepID=A0A818HL31_9BILA|nr:unnamed protein product [Adineta steineri]CAF0814702.1 unnamed protein product [Adineta steineri]CAF0902042.1 unnamed protein product [Adineta steineri]CAF0952211.1 unnamed protein product [Adineta steineri]CAF0967321.1 unnamed protein product [Adineta steineri]